MRRPSLRVVAIIAALGLAVGLAGGATYAAFFATTSNQGNSFTSVADWTAPSASGSVIAKTVGYLAGSIRQNGAYFVYATVTDTGNPASGVASVTANVSNITTGQTAAPLTTTGCPCSVNGVSYSYRSASLTASNPLTPGAKTYTLTMTDVATNSATQSGFSVTVDNTAPAGSDIQTANHAFVVGRAETNDTITYTYTESIDPQSILAGWNGTATTVTVRLNNANPDTVTIFNAANTTQLPLGSVSLARNDYVTANRTFTNSTMVQSGAIITITLGTPSGATTTAAATSTMRWTPSATAYDAAGNTCSATAVNESGAADMEF